jgi:large subunit ribosomal protein L21
MSYAIIKSGGKQFAVEEGQTVRIPSIKGDAGSKVAIEALLVGEGKDAKIGGGATVDATIVSHGRDEKIIVFKKKRRKQYKRTQGHRQGYTEVKIEKL